MHGGQHMNAECYEEKGKNFSRAHDIYNECDGILLYHFSSFFNATANIFPKIDYLCPNKHLKRKNYDRILTWPFV